MSASAPTSRQVRIEQLWPELRQLSASLWSAGLTSKRLHGIWRSSVIVACDACGTQLSEDDMLAILDLPEGAEPPAGRLQRLSQGYCTKPGCESRFFRITLAPNDDIDWPRLLAGPSQPMSSDRSTEKSQVKAPGDQKQGVLGSNKVRIAIAITALLLALLLRHWYLNGRIPFLNQTFKVAPSENVGPVVPPPLTNEPSPVGPRTNTFRIAP